jgi:two-component system chemotaxis response regulator CheB
MIRVLLVDDSPLAITVIKRMLLKSPEIEVVGTAGNGREALNLIPLVTPDIICTDLHMPKMDGLELTKEIMRRRPLPILLVSISGRKESHSAFEVLEAGALDIFLKPGADDDSEREKAGAELIRKIKILSAVHVFRRNEPGTASWSTEFGLPAELSIVHPKTRLRIIVIGASTGGPQALQTILSSLPANFPLPIVCVQHISEGFLQGLVDWLGSLCGMKVEIAEAGAFPRGGTIYFPREGHHLKIDGQGMFKISSEPPLDGHRPSVTVTMKAVAEYYKDSALGVLLTGMGKDGAEGLLAVKKAGGMTVAQDEESSIVFGMPKQAIELGAASYIAALDNIGPMFRDLTLPTAVWNG